jgi:chromosome segregation ATPase
MTKFIVGCVVLFVCAAGYIFITQAQDLAALFAAFQSETLIKKLAWFLAVLIPLAFVPATLWLCDALIRSRRAAQELESRLGGVHDSVNALAKIQADAETSIRQLARSDPEDAIGALRGRLTEAERIVQIQQSRNEVGDLQARVDELRAQQQALRERLAPILEKRRAIAQLFAELDSRESDIDHALNEIVTSDDATAIDMRLKGLAEFIRGGHERCAQIEHAAKTLAELKQAYAALGERLAPYAAAEDGVARRFKEVSDARDLLANEIESLLHTPQGDLAARLQAFADDKKRLHDGLANLELQFSRLATLRQDIESLSGNFERALQVLSPSAGAADAPAAVDELSQFIKSTQSRLDQIERTMMSFDQLKTKLGDLQTRLGPLESKNGGVADVLAQLQEVRDRLAGKLAALEADESGDLAARVARFAAAKDELEQRVATVSKHFAKLAALRSDIAGLFDKLSNVVDRD